MSKFVIKYSRGDRVKYISHLDFVRMFHRAVRRSGLDFMFSQGFNPHPIMTVAVPLSVGVTADGEYMNVGFETTLNENELMSILNGVLPSGFDVKTVKKTEGKEYDFNLIERAEYILDIECDNPNSIDVDSLMSNTEISVLKKTKSGEKETDIKPLIHSLERIEPESGNIGIRAILAAGNMATLKPETLVDAINKYQPDGKITFFAAHRKALLTKDNKELL
ncbi:MAG: TIGR03936 family radical SAM-associated protein [Eubacteriales bacterium]|nr:TIGR03936 family radical SAM-associated protein [Eubacteriales bacterium]